MTPHHNNSSSTQQVYVSYLVEKEFKVDFRIENQEEWNTNSKFSQDPTHNWGLWNHDVVECFFHYDNNPYLEIQLSPLGQAFELVIVDPRKIFYTPLTYKFNYESTLEENIWSAHLYLPLDYFPKSGKLRANFFAILGKKVRNYYALNINKEEHADFHRPELFINL